VRRGGQSPCARRDSLRGENVDLLDGSYARAALPRLAARGALRRRHCPHATALAQERARYGEPPLRLERARGTPPMGRRSAIVKLAELPELSLLQDLVARPHGFRCMREGAGGDRLARTGRRTRSSNAHTRPRHTWDFALRSAAPMPAMLVPNCPATQRREVRHELKSGHANAHENKSTGVPRRLREPRETGPGGLPPDDDTVEGPGGLQEDGCVPALFCSFPAFLMLAHHLPPPAQTNRRTRARAPPDVNLDIASLDGRGVFEKDLHKLYFVYISSKPEDWNFILEVSHPARARVPCSAPHSSPRSGDHLPRPPSVVLPALPQAISCKAAPCA
jgi:hypothetical protein